MAAAATVASTGEGNLGAERAPPQLVQRVGTDAHRQTKAISVATSAPSGNWAQARSIQDVLRCQRCTGDGGKVASATAPEVRVPGGPAGCRTAFGARSEVSGTAGPASVAPTSGPHHQPPRPGS